MVDYPQVVGLPKVEDDLKPTVSKLMADQTEYDPFKDNAYLEQGTFLLARFDKAKKTIEDQRVEFTKPLNGTLKAINRFFKTFSDPIEQADRELRDKLKEHRKQLEEKQIQEADQKGEELVLRKKIGGVVVKKVWTFKVMDETMVPQQYLVIDEVKVRAAIRSGVRQIDGLSIYQEDQVSL